MYLFFLIFCFCTPPAAVSAASLLPSERFPDDVVAFDDSRGFAVLFLIPIPFVTIVSVSSDPDAVAAVTVAAAAAVAEDDSR